MSDVQVFKEKQTRDDPFVGGGSAWGWICPSHADSYVLAQLASHHAHVNSNLLMQVFTENLKLATVLFWWKLECIVIFH